MGDNDFYGGIFQLPQMRDEGKLKVGGNNGIANELSVTGGE